MGRLEKDVFNEFNKYWVGWRRMYSMSLIIIG